MAVSFTWAGDPEYSRLAACAKGILKAPVLAHHRAVESLESGCGRLGLLAHVIQHALELNRLVLDLIFALALDGGGQEVVAASELNAVTGEEEEDLVTPLGQ